MATSDGRITQEEDPTLWTKLMELRELEKSPTGVYPGWVVKGNLSYRCFQQSDGSVAFMPKTSENLYESTSF